MAMPPGTRLSRGRSTALQAVAQAEACDERTATADGQARAGRACLERPLRASHRSSLPRRIRPRASCRSPWRSKRPRASRASIAIAGRERGGVLQRPGRPHPRRSRSRDPASRADSPRAACAPASSKRRCASADAAADRRRASARRAVSSRMRCACDANRGRGAQQQRGAAACRAARTLEPWCGPRAAAAPRVRRAAARAGAARTPGCARASRCSRTCSVAAQVAAGGGASRTAQRRLASAKRAQPLGAVRHDALGRTRGRRRALVGDEVGDREVHLVADAAHDGNRAGEDGACDRLVVERPQVLERAAAARDDQHVAVPARGRRGARPARSRAARLRPARRPGRSAPGRPGSAGAGCAGCRAARRRSAR